MKNLKLILKSLISNHACVEGGRKRAWFFAIPMFLVAVILSLVPSFVKTITTQGDAVVSRYTYEMDGSSYLFLEELNSKGVKLELKNDNMVPTDEDGEVLWEKVFTTYDYEGGHQCYIHKHKDAVSGEEFADLGVYYVGEINEDFYNSVIKFPAKDEKGEDIKVNRTYNYIIFSRKSVVIGFYSGGSNIGTVVGDYESLEKDFAVNDIFVEGDLVKTWENWKTFYRRVYDNNRVKLAWQTVGILAAINVGITVFMGLMLWVLTRGKNNLHWFGLWETQKIAYWATLSPAILSVAFGFLLTQFAQIMFPLLVGVRIMWLSMKLLRPENAEIYPSLKKNKVIDVKSVKTK